MRTWPALLVLAFLALPASSARAKRRPQVTAFDSAADALSSLLPLQPRVLALGEYHEIEGGPKVRSSIAHFTDELLPALRLSASDLILETWVTEGECGKKEETVVAKVEETTRRPETTESELVTLIKKARASGIEPHILQVSCREYNAMLDGKGEIDFVRLLGTITTLLKKKIDEVLRLRKDRPDGTVLVYGGAIHNKLAPRSELRAFTYAPAVQRETHGKLLELDLYVPEYVERDEQIAKEAWWPAARALPPDKTALVRRGPASFVIVFPRTPPAPKSPGTSPPPPR